MHIDVEIPDRFEFLADRKEWQQNLKLYTALMLFKQHKISIGAGSELAGIDIYSFMKLCGQHGIPVIDYEPGELEAEINSLMNDTP